MNSFWRRIPHTIYPILVLRFPITTKPMHTLVSRDNVKTTSVLAGLQQKNIFYNPIRSKSKKAKHDSDDEDENYNEDSSLSRDSKVVKFNTTSLRTDLILKTALGIARNKIEQQFYESKIRVNGNKVLKKSATVRLGDEIDVIKMVSPKNADHLYVSRVEILNIAAQEESITITARRFKNLLIENYAKDPYKGNPNAGSS
ncbi:mitochondrial transcription rescue factor 1 [Pectinophora gossypiella]|nr:mitochondrial transcription rescue factor 1 [Pectinophora gossypiella]